VQRRNNLPQIRGSSWHKKEIKMIRRVHYSSNFQNSNKRKSTEKKTLGYLPRVLFFNAFELGAERGNQVISNDECRRISCRKNTEYHTTDPKIRTQGAEGVRSWIATKHGDGSLETSNAQRTSERDTELYPGLGPSW
jgi:hypothetical protein